MCSNILPYFIYAFACTAQVSSGSLVAPCSCCGTCFIGRGFCFCCIGRGSQQGNKTNINNNNNNNNIKQQQKHKLKKNCHHGDRGGWHQDVDPEHLFPEFLWREDVPVLHSARRHRRPFPQGAGYFESASRMGIPAAVQRQERRGHMLVLPTSF